jgi:outer membrane receptor protein involved in Fe transport
MKKILFLFSALLCLNSIFAFDSKKNDQPKDTLYTELKSDIVILSSTKETNSLKNLPAAVSVFSPKNLEGLQVSSFKDLSSIVPNYFVADYGSKMTAPLYIRGIGARSGFQTVSMYIDNIPSFNTTAFDTELFDIQRVEVLRGTQGTLYGRNAMGGIINIYTYSPLTYEGITLKAGGGSHGEYSGNASIYKRINDKMGFSVGAYYKHNDGYFTNNYTGKKVDNMDNAGGRFKLVWDITKKLSANYSVSFDWVDQGAFPYEDIESKEINYDSDGYYKRKLITNGLSLLYKGDGYQINSTTGYQYLNDEMNMDQDYTSRSVFQINQRQKQNSISQEITIKSDNQSWYQWSTGIYGFYDYLHTTPPVYMMKDGIQEILQTNIDKGMGYAQAMIDQFLPSNLPPFVRPLVQMPTIELTDDVIDLSGHYKRPTYGAAIFHQSTFNDIFETKGLSLTLGMRLDYEKTKLEYSANAYANYNSTNGSGVTTSGIKADSTIVGKASDDYLEFLPKAVLKYEINDNSYAYVSASRGYKAGGHNIQVFADLLQGALESQMTYQIMNAYVSSIPPMVTLPPEAEAALARMSAPPAQVDINESISYKPEYSWNYEFGGQISLLNNALTTNFALYYIDVKDVQLTQFVQSRGGRMVVNGGKAASRGFEVGMKARPCNGFYLYANYGFADAKLKDYTTTGKVNGTEQEVDYSGNYIPFAPRTTFSVGGNITVSPKKCPVIDRFSIDANFAGTGKIYWEESNTMSQGFYGTLNARASVEKSIFTFEVWGKNILDRDYYSFVFESMGNHYGQVAKPARWGASLKIKL